MFRVSSNGGWIIYSWYAFLIANVKCQQFLGVALALNSYTSVSYGFGNE
jgi:hypothetical protein